MDQTTTAIYENGVLRPTVTLDLPEHSEVEITIRSNIRSNGESFRDRVGQVLESAGLSTPREIRTSPLSDARRAELAKMYSGGPPLGDYIREDRDAR